MEYSKPNLQKDLLINLSALQKHKFLFAILLEWFVIAISIYLSITLDNLFVYLISIVVIGARQHSFFVLMHDASHYRGLSNRKMNDTISNLFLAWPLFFTLEGYRKSHLNHHKYTNTIEDPDWKIRQNSEWEFPMKKSKLSVFFIKDILGISLLFEKCKDILRFCFNKKIDYGYSKFSLMRVTYYMVIVAIFAYSGWILEFFIYWVVPLCTWTEALVRLRNISEHYGMRQKNIGTLTRTIDVSLLSKLFIGTRNANYHLEHHLYPSVPFYNLPKLRESLMKYEEFKNSVHITKGYVGVLKECVK